VRMACELYLVGIVVRDVLWPWYDPVQRELDRVPEPAREPALS
jgi:hypothetical protein